jgi:hypothetical protein
LDDALVIGYRFGRRCFSESSVSFPRVQEVLAVTSVASGQGHRDGCSVDVFSWSELPELLAAEDLFTAAAVQSGPLADVFARGDEDADDDEEFEDDDDDEEDEDYEDDEEEDEEEDDVDDEDDEWEEVDDEEDEEEDDEEEEDEDEDEDWEDDDEDWEDEDEDEDDDDED